MGPVVSAFVFLISNTGLADVADWNITLGASNVTDVSALTTNVSSVSIVIPVAVPLIYWLSSTQVIFLPVAILISPVGAISVNEIVPVIVPLTVKSPATVVVEPEPAPIVTSTSPLSSACPAIVKPAVNVASFSDT